MGLRKKTTETMSNAAPEIENMAQIALERIEETRALNPNLTISILLCAANDPKM